MAGTIGDMIQLTLSGEYLEQTVMNIFFYRVADTPTEDYLEGLATEFQETVLTPLAAATVTELTWDSIRCLNIFSGDEFITSDITPSGGSVNTGNAILPSFVAAGYKLIRANARVRNGYKYFAGLDAVWVSENNFSGAYLALAANVEAGLEADLVAGGGLDTFEPAIVGRVREGTEGDYTYRLPVSQVEMGTKWSTVNGAQVNPNVTTERSRKEGHGI